ncbi:MAG: SPFH domain-containing protein [Firmicutes bacterium]|nr:SPFH domain-containing protein [Bacillota bacterium]
MPFRRQLLKLIEWGDTRSDLIAFKFPMDSRAEIMNGSTLVVREGQVAIFTKDGKIADIFPPGRHRLETANMPVLTTLMNWHHGFRNPFKCDVYFVNTTVFTGQKWGTANPFTMRDPEFGVIRIRGFGTYNFRVQDPKMLMLQLLGARNEFTVQNIKDKLRSIITSNISNIIAEAKYSAIDLSMKLRDFSAIAQEKLQPMFEAVGFSLTLMVVENISFPEEVERSLDERSSVGIMSDKMGSFVAMQQAKAMRDMAQQPGGMGGAFMGMGIGGAFGGAMGGGSAMNNVQDSANTGLSAANRPNPQGAAPAAAACIKCQAALAPGARFCGNCGTSQEPPKCKKCNTTLAAGARFCGQCGTAQ